MRCETALIGAALLAGVSDSYNNLTVGWTDVMKLLPSAAPAAGVLTAGAAEGLGFTAAGAGAAGSLVSGVAEAGAFVAGVYLLGNTAYEMGQYMSNHSCVGR